MEASSGYRVEAQLAGGAIIQVLLATHVRGETRVLKQLRQPILPRGRALLRAEAQALADICHVNVVELIETIADTDGPITLVLEHLPGPTLASVSAKHGSLPWTWVAQVLTALARALAAVHAAGYLHLDVKPANIICVDFDDLDQAINVKLIDFGLARSLDADDLNEHDPTMGTIGYVAPERLAGCPLDERSDLFALGCLGFELLAGRAPFEDARAALEGPAPRLTEVNPAVIVPDALEHLLAALLERDPDMRPRTASEVQGQLAALPTTADEPNVAPDLLLAVLASRVRDAWLAGVLDASVEGLTLIPQPMRISWKLGGELVALEARSSLAEVFGRANGRLQILAPAGYGKTVQTLKLVRRLLDEHRREPERPIPVVFGMSEWRAGDDSIPEFLSRQLMGKYALSARHARRLVEQARILAVLDGLDEIPREQRASAVTAINHYLAVEPNREVVVNYRSDAEDLRALTIATNVELGPLERGLTARYLGGEWQRLRGLLERDAELERLSATPLMLQLMRVSARDEGFGDRTEGNEHAVAWLFGRYVASTLASSRGCTVDEPRLIAGLVAVAGTLRRCDRAMLVCEELQPSALASERLRILYLWASRLGVATILTAIAIPVVALSPLDNSGFEVDLRFALSLGVATLLVTGLGFVVWSKLGERVRRSIPATLAWGVGLGALSGLALPGCEHFVVWVFAIEGALFGALLLGVSRRARSFPNDDIATVETLRWDFAGVAPRTWALLGATVVLLFIGFVQIEPTSTALEIAGLVGVLGAAIVGSRHGLIEAKVTPNLGIHRSLRSAGLAAGFGFAVAALAFGLVYGLSYGLLGGVFVAIFGGLWFGGIDGINHGILRVLLAVERSLSLRPFALLEDAVRLGFMRRVGNGYMFAHLSLRDHFGDRSRAA